MPNHSNSNTTRRLTRAPAGTVSPSLPDMIAFQWLLLHMLRGSHMLLFVVLCALHVEDCASTSTNVSMAHGQERGHEHEHGGSVGLARGSHTLAAAVNKLVSRNTETKRPLPV